MTFFNVSGEIREAASEDAALAQLNEMVEDGDIDEDELTEALEEGLCEQRCGEPATVYAIDPIPNGWGGRYCETCATTLRFQVIDRLKAA